MSSDAPTETSLDTTYSFSHHAVEVVSGRRTIEQLGFKLDELGAKRAMVICGPSILKNSDVVQRTEAALGDRLVGRFSAIRPHQLMEDLVAARDEARAVDPDVLVSVGGGTNVTAAKVVALMLSTDRDPSEFALRFEPPDKYLEPEVPLPDFRVKVVSVSTTMGGADLGGSGGGFTDTASGRKFSLYGRGETCPKIVVVDGEALMTTPEATQRATTIGQLRVAVESFSSNRHNPVSDASAIHSMKLLSAALGEGWRLDVEYLLRIKTGTMLASLCGQAHPTVKGANTAIAQTIGAQFNEVSHGDANAIMLPHTMRFNSRGIPPERFAMLRHALGLEPEGGLDGPGDQIAAFCTALGLPARLRDVGVPQSGLPAIAAAAFKSAHLAANPVPISDERQIVEILESAW